MSQTDPDHDQDVAVSVIIPTFNRADFIEDSVRSALRQDVSSLEILVIDDGSTDRSMELIADFPVKIINMGGNQGLAAARNRAYNEAKNETIYP